MKQEAKGKIFVGMIVSIVAFGFATGTGFLMGANPINTNGILNLTQQSQFPTLPASTNTNVKTSNQTTNVQSGQSGQSNTVTPSNPTNSGNSSNKPSNSNKTGNST